MSMRFVLFQGFVAAAVVVGACGPNSGETESGNGTDSTGAGTGSTSPTSAGTGETDSWETGGPTTSGGSATTDTTGIGSATDSTGTTGTTDTTTMPMSECAGLSREACNAAPDCAVVTGLEYRGPDCQPGPQYLGCIPQTVCDDAGTDICNDQTGVAYQLTDGCVPPGFSSCDSGGLPLCGAMPGMCDGLPQMACAQAEGCTGIRGAPHVVKGDQKCADYDNQQFLGCVENLPCPPAVNVLCADDAPDQAFDVPSGCIPPGFSMCGEPVPEC